MSARMAELCPCCCSESVREVHLNGGGYYWDEISAELHADQSNLLYHGKVGKAQHVYLAPKDIPQAMESRNLTVRPPSTAIPHDNCHWRGLEIEMNSWNALAQGDLPGKLMQRSTPTLIQVCIQKSCPPLWLVPVCIKILQSIYRNLPQMYPWSVKVHGTRNEPLNRCAFGALLLLFIVSSNATQHLQGQAVSF